MKNRLRGIVKIFLFPLRKINRALIKIRIVKPYLLPVFINAFKWLWKSTEYSNFYYELTPRNMRYLAQSIATTFNISRLEIENYFTELNDDIELRKHISQGLKRLNVGSDSQIKYGRRVVWYALARATKPKLVVETGVEHGVGSCVLAAALLRNRVEGYPGFLICTDINPKAGKLLIGQYKDVTKIIYGDSVMSIGKIEEKIDLFINDSDHDSSYEMLEYKTIASQIHPSTIIIGDNSHSSDALSEFSVNNNRNFIYFSEQPQDHWYPGGGIGISLGKSLGE